MMTQRIQEGKIALVFRNGNYLRVLKPGFHFIGLFDEVKVYDTALPFNAPITLVVIPDECQSMPITAPNDWNQKGCESRRRNSSRP